METLKVKIKKVIVREVSEEQEKEISLPFFSKKEIHFYMIREDKTVISVTNYSGWDESDIYVSGENTPEFNKAVNGEIITREEFMAEYNKAMNKISELETTNI